MAEQPLTLVGDVLVELLREGMARIKPAAQQAIEHLREVSVPPDGITFRSEDGASYTGIVLLDANKVVAMIAARSDPPLVIKAPHQERLPPAERPPLVTPPPAPQRPYYSSQRSFYEREREPEDDDMPDWGEREHGGYNRYK